MTARFTVASQDGMVGVLDHDRKMFAPFLEDEFSWAPAEVRARATCVALITGAQTTTGFTWEKAHA